MLAATLAHTQAGPTIVAEPRGEGRDQDRSRHTLIVLFLALTILVKPLVVGETLPVS